jgi:hypothetical protein
MKLENGLKPVIIGTSISGMAISKNLSDNKIEHILIGEPVKEKRPILGESVEMFGTKIITELFPNQEKHFYPKLGINYHLDKSTCHFDFKRSFKLPIIVELMKKTNYTYMAEGSYSLIHIDRALFDAAIYHEVIASPYCNYINSRVKNVDYDKDQDSIDKIYTECGLEIKPSYVYDGSNALRVLATMLNLEIHYLTKPMRLIFAHYRLQEKHQNQISSTTTPWYVYTNILRHYKKNSGFDGSSWCIPVGNHLSIGTNLNEDCGLSDDEILEVTRREYEKRGISYDLLYTDEVNRTPIKGPLYYCKKVFGKNWVLASGAAALTWYTAQTGVESAMFVANIADRLLKYPEFYGKYFQDFVERQVKMHQIHDWLHFEGAVVSEESAYEFMVNSIRNIQSRYLLGLLSIENNPLMHKLEWLSDISNYCKNLNGDEMREIINAVKRGETAAEYLMES